EPARAASLPQLAAPVEVSPLISSDCGRITDEKFFDSNQIVINIQDLHCHAEVQRNISKILETLDRKYRLDNVFVEGGYGDIDTSWMCNITDKTVKKEILNTLVNAGKLTGAEYYSVQANRPTLLKGLEDEALHKDNIKRLGVLLEKKSVFDNNLTVLSQDLAVMKDHYFTSKNKSFESIVEKYRNGNMDPVKYYTLLGKYIDAIEKDPNSYKNMTYLDMNDYPTVASYIGTLRSARKLNYQRISRELQHAVAGLKTQISYREYAELLEKTNNLTDMDAVCVALSKLSKAHAIPLNPSLEEFFAYNDRSHAINPVKLIDEDRRLVTDIRVALSDNVSEHEVSFLAGFYPYYQDYLLNKLTADDCDYFYKKFDTFKNTWGKYAARNHIMDVADSFPVLDDFYTVNRARNDSFINHIMPAVLSSSVDAKALKQQSRSVETSTPVIDDQAALLSALNNGTRPIVIVTGGFHTQGLKKLLEDRKISYLTIMPMVTKDAKQADASYAAFAREQATILSNALALTEFFNLKRLDEFKIAVTALAKVNYSETHINYLINVLKRDSSIKVKDTIFSQTDGIRQARITFEDGSWFVITENRQNTMSFAAYADEFGKLIVTNGRLSVGQASAAIDQQAVPIWLRKMINANSPLSRFALRGLKRLGFKVDLNQGYASGNETQPNKSRHTLNSVGLLGALAVAPATHSHLIMSVLLFIHSPLFLLMMPVVTIVSLIILFTVPNIDAKIASFITYEAATVYFVKTVSPVGTFFGIPFAWIPVVAFGLYTIAHFYIVFKSVRSKTWPHGAQDLILKSHAASYAFLILAALALGSTYHLAYFIGLPLVGAVAFLKFVTGFELGAIRGSGSPDQHYIYNRLGYLVGIAFFLKLFVSVIHPIALSWGFIISPLFLIMIKLVDLSQEYKNKADWRKTVWKFAALVGLGTIMALRMPVVYHLQFLWALALINTIVYFIFYRIFESQKGPGLAESGAGIFLIATVAFTLFLPFSLSISAILGAVPALAYVVWTWRKNKTASSPYREGEIPINQFKEKYPHNQYILINQVLENSGVNLHDLDSMTSEQLDRTFNKLIYIRNLISLLVGNKGLSVALDGNADEKTIIKNKKALAQFLPFILAPRIRIPYRESRGHPHGLSPEVIAGRQEDHEKIMETITTGKKQMWSTALNLKGLREELLGWEGTRGDVTEAIIEDMHIIFDWLRGAL
ncbi:MAG: hypothetical protein ABSH12_09280, partial [Endomicrobiales bacterium]